MKTNGRWNSRKLPRLLFASRIKKWWNLRTCVQKWKSPESLQLQICFHTFQKNIHTRTHSQRKESTGSIVEMFEPHVIFILWNVTQTLVRFFSIPTHFCSPRYPYENTSRYLSKGFIRKRKAGWCSRLCWALLLSRKRASRFFSFSMMLLYLTLLLGIYIWTCVYVGGYTGCRWLIIACSCPTDIGISWSRDLSFLEPSQPLFPANPEIRSGRIFLYLYWYMRVCGFAVLEAHVWARCEKRPINSCYNRFSSAVWAPLHVRFFITNLKALRFIERTRTRPDIIFFHLALG